MQRTLPIPNNNKNTMLLSSCCCRTILVVVAIRQAMKKTIPHFQFVDTLLLCGDLVFGYDLIFELILFGVGRINSLNPIDENAVKPKMLGNMKRTSL